MDIKRLNIPTLDSPNWGIYIIALQAVAQILDLWDAMRGEILTQPPNLTYNLLIKLTLGPATATAAEIAAYSTAKTIWSKKNAQGLGLIQATISPVIWQDYQHLSTAKELLDALEATFGAVGGASTYLQLVNMVKIQFTDLMDLLPQIQGFQDNYNQITSNGHSRLSEDLATFMFCSNLPDSYESTAWQYLDNITAIVNYKISDIITQVFQEESRHKDQALGQGSSLNKFSTMKNIGQKCTKCGKMNHTMQNHWPRGKDLNKKGKGLKPQKSLNSSEKEKSDKKGKGKEKAQTSANVLDAPELADLSIQTAQSIDFSGYKKSEKVE